MKTEEAMKVFKRGILGDFLKIQLKGFLIMIATTLPVGFFIVGLGLEGNPAAVIILGLVAGFLVTFKYLLPRQKAAFEKRRDELANNLGISKDTKIRRIR